MLRKIHPVDPQPSSPSLYDHAWPRLQLDHGGSRRRMLGEYQRGDHWDFLIGRVATSGHSHVWLAQEPFLLFPSVNGSATAACGPRETQGGASVFIALRTKSLPAHNSESDCPP